MSVYYILDESLASGFVGRLASSRPDIRSVLYPVHPYPNKIISEMENSVIFLELK